MTWRLAARFADDLHVDGLTPGEVRDGLPVIGLQQPSADSDEPLEDLAEDARAAGIEMEH